MKKRTNTPIAQSVMKQIKGGLVTMRSRAYFVAIALLSVIAIGAIASLLAYCLGILFFWLRIQTADTMAWGARAHLASALENFPWWIALGAITAFALTIWLIKKQGRMYRYKTHTIVITLAVASLLLGLLLSYVGIGNNHFGGRPGRGFNQPHQQQTNDPPRFLK